MTEKVECWNCETVLLPREGQDAVERPEFMMVEQDQVSDRELYLCAECEWMLEEPEIVAALVLDVQPDDLEPLGGGSHVNEYRGGGMECMVVEDRDFDDVFKARIEDYVFESLMADVPESLRYYFDVEQYADDARSDGLAVWFSYTYEHDVNVQGTYYYAFTRG